MNVVWLQINLLLAEPFYSASVLPWHDLHLWYTRTALADKLADKAFIMPQGATMRAIAVQFDHLWKIRAPVGVCEGFNISHFDKVINVSARYAHNMYFLDVIKAINYMFSEDSNRRSRR